MALKQDQPAMLPLLLERGQTYEDIASLLGVEREDAKARARAALTELAGEDPDSEVGVSDYLLGQADPIGRADETDGLFDFFPCAIGNSVVACRAVDSISTKYVRSYMYGAAP